MRPWLAYLLVGWSPALWAADLLHVYQQALMKDQTYLVAQATWKAAEQAIPLARSAILPSLSLSGYYKSFHATDGKEAGISDHNFNYTATLSQSLFDYAAWSSLAESTYAVRAARATLAEAAEQVMISTITDYFAVLSAEEALDVAKEQRKYYKQTYRQVSQMFKAGMATTADLYAARSTLDLQEAQVLSSAHDVDVALEDLSVLTGEHYTHLNRLGHLHQLSPPMPNDIHAWANQSMAQNFSLQAALMTAKAAEKGIAVAKGARMPSVTMAGTYSRTSQQTASPSVAAAASSSARPINEALLTLSAALPIYQGGAVAAGIRQAFFSHEAAMASYLGLKRQTIANTRKYYMNVMYGIRSIKANRLAVMSADSALSAAMAAYKAGTLTLTEVYEASRDLAMAKQSLIDQRYAYLLNIAELKRSVGSLKAEDIAELSKLMTQSTKKKPGEHHASKNPAQKT